MLAARVAASLHFTVWLKNVYRGCLSDSVSCLLSQWAGLSCFPRPGKFIAGFTNCFYDTIMITSFVIGRGSPV